MYRRLNSFQNKIINIKKAVKNNYILNSKKKLKEYKKVYKK